MGYEYNSTSSLLEAAAACEDDLAAVIVSAFDYRYSRQALIAPDQICDNITLVGRFGKCSLFRDLELPTEEFAKAARELCDQTGALLIVDDVRAGFRFQRSKMSVGSENYRESDTDDIGG